VRLVCDNCKEEYTPSEGDLAFLNVKPEQRADVKLWHGRGCNKCNLTGFKGRKGIFEIFKVTEEIQRLIFERVPAHELRALARQHGMRTLREDGVRKALAGVTTVKEVMTTTMGDVD